MRRVGICCVLSLLLIAAVGRAAPLGLSNGASTVGSKLRTARLLSTGSSARRPAVTARAKAGGHAVLFGNQTVQRTVGRIRAGRAIAFPFAVHRAGTVSAISIYVDAHNKAKKLIVALYSNRSANPIRRVASGTLSLPKAGSWNTVSVTRARVRRPSTYWIAVLGRGGTLYFRDHHNRTCHSETNRKSHLASLPRLWTTGTRLNTCPISAYATGNPTNTPTTFGTLAPPNQTPVNTGGTTTSGAAPQVGAPTPGGVSCTQTLNPGANVGSALSSASPGSVVCLNSGGWSAITLNGVAPASPGVTLAATPGQTVSVPGFVVTGANTQNLTIEGFHVTTPVSNVTGFDIICGITGAVTLEYNTVEDQPKGPAFNLDPSGCGSGHSQTGVMIEYNQMDHVGSGVESDGITNLTISHNVIGPYIGYGDTNSATDAQHYIQIGGTATGITVDNNAFEGPYDPGGRAAGVHNNVFHMFNGKSNVTFANNIMWHTQNMGNASVLLQDSPMDNITIENNLDVEDPADNYPSSNTWVDPVEVEAPHGFNFEHNTIVNAGFGMQLGDTCPSTCNASGQNMTAEYNVAAPGAVVTGGGGNYGKWNCSSSCTARDNVTADTTANTMLGGTNDVVNWTANWANTSWTPVNGPGYKPPPSGYYQPTGLSISNAGYQGQIGP